MTDPNGAAIYGVPWIPSIYPLYVSIYIIITWILYGLWKLKKITVRPPAIRPNPLEQVAGRVQISQRPWLCSIPPLELTGIERNDVRIGSMGTSSNDSWWISVMAPCFRKPEES